MDVKLKNETNKYISARGTYFCRLNMNNYVISTPPPICTFKISWVCQDKSKQTTNKLLNISNSSYDYMHELKSEQQTNWKHFKSNFELPTLSVNDTTQLYKNVKTSSNEICENRNGRYDIIEISSSSNNEGKMLDTFVGGLS